uniref:Putative secreted peptide n=1 Tax=Anopheles braziliensis TaxID=58242 RepID=A0A2M3ZQD7_9DIPT
MERSYFQTGGLTLRTRIFLLFLILYDPIVAFTDVSPETNIRKRSRKTEFVYTSLIIGQDVPSRNGWRDAVVSFVILVLTDMTLCATTTAAIVSITICIN